MIWIFSPSKNSTELLVEEILTGTFIWCFTHSSKLELTLGEEGCESGRINEFSGTQDLRTIVSAALFVDGEYERT